MESFAGEVSHFNTLYFYFKNLFAKDFPFCLAAHISAHRRLYNYDVLFI